MHSPGLHPTRQTRILLSACWYILVVVLLAAVDLIGYQQLRSPVQPPGGPQPFSPLLGPLLLINLGVVTLLSIYGWSRARRAAELDAVYQSAQAASLALENELRAQFSDQLALSEALQTQLDRELIQRGQLRDLQKLNTLAKFVGSVNHEFNNYLTVIIGLSEMLLNDLPPGAAAHDNVVQILRAGQNSAELTVGLLNLVRKGERKSRLMDLNVQIESLRRMLAVVLGKDVDLEVALQNDLPMIESVPGHLEQVLLNLAANARDAMPQGGRVLIETSSLQQDVADGGLRAGHYLVLSVTDTGCGFDAETRRHLFEPFFTTKEQGTGLGLATVQEIVTDSGGCIVADSVLGQGTTFKVYWPSQVARATRETLSMQRDTLGFLPRSNRETLLG